MGDYPWDFMLGQRARAASKMGTHTHKAGVLYNKDRDRVSVGGIKEATS